MPTVFIVDNKDLKRCMLVLCFSSAIFLAELVSSSLQALGYFESQHLSITGATLHASSSF